VQREPALLELVQAVLQEWPVGLEPVLLPEQAVQREPEQVQRQGWAQVLGPVRALPGPGLERAQVLRARVRFLPVQALPGPY